MAGDSVQVAQVPCTFTSHSATLEAGPSKFILRVLKMNGSTMLFLNNENETFNQLAVAMPARKPSSDILSSTIIGGHGQTESELLAGKLSKRYSRQFFVSINMPLDRIVGPLFEKTLVTYIHNHQDQFL